MTDYPNTSAREVSVVANGIEWAPVNLGTDADHPMGKYYQWGRKEGFTYVDPVGSTPGKVSSIYGPKTEAFALANPSYFIYTYGGNGRSSYNWLDVADNDPNNTYWTSTGGTQNPCPAGWRVPTREEMETLRGTKKTDTTQTNAEPYDNSNYNNLGRNYYYDNVSTNTGMWFGSAATTNQRSQDVNVYLPAAGYIQGTSGNCSDKGVRGYYWTASPTSEGSGSDIDFAVYLRFSSTANDVKSLVNQGRAYGFSIRCVRTI